MVGGRRVLALGLAGLALAATILVVVVALSRPPEPLEVVQRWIDARNRGDVEETMELLAETGNILGVAVHLPGGREQLRAIFEGQAVAGWTIEDSDCVVEADEIRCTYFQHDRILDRWGLGFTGQHRYIVRDGKLGLVERVHDPSSRDTAYDAIEDFRAWVHLNHPELDRVIWSTPGAALYTTPDGARAALAVLDEYEASRH